MDENFPVEVEGKRERGREKIRSAWISFVGRIAAQLIGAVATVGLGVVVLSGRLPPATPIAAATSAPSRAQQNVLVAKHVRTQHGTVIVLIPFERYRDINDETVAKVTEALVTDFSQSGGDGAEDQVSAVVWAAANAH